MGLTRQLWSNRINRSSAQVSPRGGELTLEIQHRPLWQLPAVSKGCSTRMVRQCWAVGTSWEGGDLLLVLLS